MSNIVDSKNFPKGQLYSFFIFDSVPPTKEGSTPTIYFYRTNDPEIENDKTYQLNQIGFILVFMTFCRQFSTDSPLDYIFTKSHEYCLLQLSGSVWMAAVLDSKKPENRSILSSILHHFRNLFSLFFCPLNDSDLNQNVARREVVDAISEAFPPIINSVNWEKLDFRYLFNSYVYQKFKKNVNLDSICERFLEDNRGIFDNIMILYSHNRVITSTFKDPYVTRTVAFSMHKRFYHLFLHNPQRESDKLTWIIGLYINNSGLNSIYQPVIYIDGVPHLLVAFRLNNFKIILTQCANIEVTEEFLLSIPKRLSAISEKLQKSNIVSPPNFRPIDYALAKNNYITHEMKFTTKDLDALSERYLDRYFIKSHEIAFNYDRTATIFKPQSKNSFVVCQRNLVKKDEEENEHMNENLLFVKPNNYFEKLNGISYNLNISAKTMRSKNEEDKDSNCLIS